MQHQNLFVFDIETIPDTASAKRLLSIDSNKIEELRTALTNYHLEITDQKNSFLRQPFHQVITISFLIAEIQRDFNGNESYNLVDIRSGGDLVSSELDLIKGFFQHLKKNFSRLVSFNGRNFDLPVLKYRAMKYGIDASWLYKNGDKWNNFNQRYSLDWHCDLVEAFSDFGTSAKVKMNELCAVFDLPGKIGIDGSKVSELFDQGEIQTIRNYCETDVINTYLLYLTYQHHCGTLTTPNFHKCQEQLENFMIKKSQENNPNRSHFKQYLQHWKDRK